MSYPNPRPQNFRLGVRRSTMGLELYAKENIPSGSFIIEYYGELVPDEVAQQVGGKYLFELENGYTILGATRKNTARYANHACEPNSEVEIEGNRVFIEAIQDIEANDPITYDYGEEYFDMLIKPMGCKCLPCVA